MSKPTHPICPRCGGPIPNAESPGAYPGALSRVDNRTEICSRCGVLEALSGFMGEIRYEQELDNQEVAAEPAALARDCELCYGECICPGGPQ